MENSLHPWMTHYIVQSCSQSKSFFLCSDVILYLLTYAFYLLADVKLDMSQQCTPTSQKFSCILSYIKGIPSRLRKEILPHYSPFVRSTWIFIQLWDPQLKKDVDLLEWVQRTTTKNDQRDGTPLLCTKVESAGGV